MFTPSHGRSPDWVFEFFQSIHGLAPLSTVPANLTHPRGVSMGALLRRRVDQSERGAAGLAVGSRRVIDAGMSDFGL